MEIQNALVTSRLDTYAEMVKTAQRVEDGQATVREFQNARRIGPKSMGNQRGGAS